MGVAVARIMHGTGLVSFPTSPVNLLHAGYGFPACKLYLPTIKIFIIHDLLLFPRPGHKELAWCRCSRGSTCDCVHDCTQAV